MGEVVRINWKPQPKQLKFLRACGLAHPFDKKNRKPAKPVSEIIGYGGAAGGGKSDALMGTAIVYCLTYPGARVGYFRQTFTQLNGSGGAIARSRELLSHIATFNGTDHEWVFPNGSTLRFCYLARDADLPNYQSQQFDVLLFDEATQFPWKHIAWMQQRIRSVKGYPTFTGLATNPGGIGHYWFKKFFVRAGEPEMPIRVEVEDNKYKNIIFIPSRLEDNQILEQADPDYRKKLENLPDNLKRQFLDGDWDVAEGMAFTEWRENIHICNPFQIDDEWIRFRAADWGYAKPYSVYWFAVDFDGRLYCYRELYGWGGKEDVGSKEDPKDVAKKIYQAELREDGTLEPITYSVADDAVFGGRQDNSPSIAEQLNDALFELDSRLSQFGPVGKGPRSRVSGKIEMHYRLKWGKNEHGVWDGEQPMLVFFNTCVHAIRTIPSLVLDKTNPEDVDTTMEDHAYDGVRYGCMSRPIVPKEKQPDKSEIQKDKEKRAKAIKMSQYHIG